MLPQNVRTMIENEDTEENFTYKGTFTIINDKGLHARPSTELVKCATKFQAHISLQSPDNSANAKSMLGVLMLAATKDTCIEIEANGEDAQEAVEAILELAENGFMMDY